MLSGRAAGTPGRECLSVPARGPGAARGPASLRRLLPPGAGLPGRPPGASHHKGATSMCEKHFNGKMKRLLVHISYTVKVAIHVSGWDSLTLDIRVDSNRLRISA